MIGNKITKLNIVIQKELNALARSEIKLRKKAKAPTSSYRERLASKIPAGLNHTLQTSFSKAFGVIFKHGVGIIEKTYDKDSLIADYDIQNYAIEKKGTRRELRRLKNATVKSDFANVSFTAVEGIGLGVLGIGLPDIVLFIGMVLKGIYEIALRYGYDYHSSAEKYLILKMIATALSRGDEWETGNREVDETLCSPPFASEDTIKEQIDRTARLFAADMLVLKFIQGFPIIGMIGGAFNPVYYERILKYVRLKYHKRYLIDKLTELNQ